MVIGSNSEDSNAQAKIIDCDVSKQTKEISVLYQDAESQTTKLLVAQLDRQSPEGLIVREDFSIGQFGKRVSYTRDNSIFVLTDQDWNIFNSNNSEFVSQVAEKVQRNYLLRVHSK